MAFTKWISDFTGRCPIGSPFGIYYDLTETAVEVYAVLDLRKYPFWIRAELLPR
jgi:hypothetical protein